MGCWLWLAALPNQQGMEQNLQQITPNNQFMTASMAARLTKLKMLLIDKLIVGGQKMPSIGCSHRTIAAASDNLRRWSHNVARQPRTRKHALMASLTALSLM